MFLLLGLPANDQFALTTPTQLKCRRLSPKTESRRQFCSHDATQLLSCVSVVGVN